MINFSEIKGLFRPDLVVSHMRNLPKIYTPVMDTIFTDRRQLPFPVVNAEEIAASVHELPVIHRGTNAIPLTSETHNYNMIEPLPVRMSENISARDLLDLKVLNNTNQELWVKNKLDLMRRTYRKSVEGISAVAISGKIEWPLALSNGSFQTYTVNYGVPLSVSIEVMWNDTGSTMKDAFKGLKAMKKALKEHGYATNLEIWAGETAYETLFALADNHPAKSSVAVKVDEAFIDVSGFKVKDRSETFRNPETKEVQPIVADDEVVMISKDAGHKLVYCAVDDLDANLQPVPFFTKPVKNDEPSAIMLIGEGKPLPIVNVKGICKAKVIKTA